MHRSVAIVEYDSVDGDFEPEGACLHYDSREMGEVRTDSRVRASAIPLTVELSLELPSTRDNYQEIDVRVDAGVATSPCPKENNPFEVVAYQFSRPCDKLIRPRFR